MISATVLMVLFLSALAVASNITVENSVKKAFSNYQKAVKSGNFKKAWNCYSTSFQSKENYESFIKGIDKDSRDIVSGLIVEEINPTKSTSVILKTKVGGFWGKFAKKKKFYFRFVLEEGSWKIQEMYQSSFSRPPRRGYRPEDFSKLDENTQKEITAIRQFCMKYTTSLSNLDFRTAWGCLEKKDLSYEKFLTFGPVRKLKKDESFRKYYASLTVLDIKISGDKATADIGRKKDSETGTVYVLNKTGNTWKITDTFDTTSLRFDEDRLPLFYFEKE